MEIEWALRSCSESDGVFAADELPENPRLLVVNTDPINRPGRHRVCICVENGYREYFDSWEIANFQFRTLSEQTLLGVDI